MKKVISAILTVSMLLSVTSVAFAEPKAKPEKPTTTTTTTVTSKGKTAAAEAKSKVLDKSKDVLIKKCDSVVAQLEKLKSYINPEQLGLTTGDSIIVESITAIDNAIKLINDETANNGIDSYVERIKAATTTQALKDISKELQNYWLKNQTFVKRITGLTSAARLNKAYVEIKALVEKLGAGINGITDDAASKLKKADLQAAYTKITASLEEAHKDYLDAVKLYSTITSTGDKADKAFKDAHTKLMEAKDGLHDTLIETKQLLVKIKNIGKVDAEDNDTEETATAAEDVD